MDDARGRATGGAEGDGCGARYAVWDRDTAACSRDILNAARAYDVGMEINALGMRKQARKSSDNPFPPYPWRPFWELAAECDAPVIVNSDAHRPEDLQGLAGQAHTLRVERASRLADLPRQRQDRQDDSWAGAKHGAR